MTAYRIEDHEGYTVGRIIEDGAGRISWHCTYELAGYDAQGNLGSLDALLDGLAENRFHKVTIY